MTTISTISSKPDRVRRLLRKNKRRQGAIIYNDSNKTLYVGLGSKPTFRTWSLLLPPGSLYEIPQFFTGNMYCYCPLESNGYIRVTEMLNDR